MEDLDLDEFILNIEQSAPQDADEPGKHRCQECDTILEDVEGTFICPNCSAQDTNIVEFEEPEVAFNESGQPYMGQSVATFQRKKGHKPEYGWAWSTDEAIIHILDLQVEALTKANLVPSYFRQGVRNLWIKFWVENIAPYIRDSYQDDELVPISVKKALKMRDIEVLFKVRDKVLLPKQAAPKARSSRSSTRMFGARMTREQPHVASGRRKSLIESDDDFEEVEKKASKSLIDQDTSSDTDTSSADDLPDLSNPSVEEINTTSTGEPKIDNVSILTLNRTIAFIEAAARCLDLPTPIFSSDIIRACNQRVIPFFGAHKTLPEGMRLNYMDRNAFQRNRAPTVQCLNITACMLIYRIYGVERPIKLKLPRLDKIFLRFFTDMNLPRDLLELVSKDVSFNDFKATKDVILKTYGKGRFTKYPMYDRWAFAILLSQLKKLFNLEERSVRDQRDLAMSKGERFFRFYDWILQISMRLKIVTSYDPYILYHPMADTDHMVPTPQLYNYLNQLISDRETVGTRTHSTSTFNDDDLRRELTDFLTSAIPIPKSFNANLMFEEKDLDPPVDLVHPIRDAFKRTKRFWHKQVCKDPENTKILFQDFRGKQIVILNSIDSRRWSIYDNVTFRSPRDRIQYEVMPQWPFCFRLLLSVGAYLCYCLPKDILEIFVAVEHHLYPAMEVQRRLMRARAGK